MDRISKIDRGTVIGKVNNIALGSKYKYFVLKKVDLKRAEEFVGVIDILFGFDKRANPLKLCIDIGFYLFARFIFPMRRDTVLRNPVHFPGSYLHFKGDTLFTDNCGMQRTVHIGFGSGNIILKPTGN